MTIASQGFVGRERELAHLDELASQALSGQFTVSFVTGEAGAGKTALVTEFARRVQEVHRDLVFAIGDCNAHTGIGDPYLPFREILGQLTGDVERVIAEGVITEENGRRLRRLLRSSGRAIVDYGPALIEIFVPGSELLARVGARMARRLGWTDRLQELLRQKKELGAIAAEGFDQRHLFEQYANVLKSLAEERPLLLVLDDLHWVDPASASLLFHLCRRLEGKPILILGTYRPTEVDVGRADGRHPLASVLNEIKRLFGDARVNLDGTDESEGRKVVEALIDREPNRLDEEFRSALYRHTRGQPLFTIELLRSLRERGDLMQDEEGRWITARRLEWNVLPARVEGVIEERIGRLGDEERGILSAASVEGEDFTAEVVARVQRLDERETIRRLSGELDKRHHLVGAAGVRRLGRRRLSMYQFRHNLFRTYLYTSFDEAERSYLHEDVALALEELYGDETEGIAASLAAHFIEAAQDEKAIGYLIEAGAYARRIYANEEAAAYFKRGLELLDGLPSDVLPAERDDIARRLHEGLGDVLALTGKHAEARVELEAALSLAPATEQLSRARLHRKIGDSWQGQHEGDRALEALAAAQRALGERPAEPSPEWWHEWIETQLARAWVYYFTARDTEIAELADETRPIVARYGTAVQRATFLQRLTLIQFRRERYALSEETLAGCRAGYEASVESGNPVVLCDGQFALGFTHLWRGELDEAQRELESALQRAEQLGSSFHRILCLTYLAVLHRFRGQPDAAAPCIDGARELATATDIKTYVAAAQANLAWVAWREDDPREAERQATAALEIWRLGLSTYPLQWLALWPLLAVTAVDGRHSEAIDCARLLLDPSQQRLPDAETQALQAALDSWERHQADSARAHLERAIEAARGAGHL